MKSHQDKNHYSKKGYTKNEIMFGNFLKNMTDIFHAVRDNSLTQNSISFMSDLHSKGSDYISRIQNATTIMPVKIEHDECFGTNKPKNN